MCERSERMGLFGPSWSWEEIKRKDALMGDLKKENDRILKEQRKIAHEISNEQNFRADGDLGIWGLLCCLVFLMFFIWLSFVMTVFLLTHIDLQEESALGGEMRVLVGSSILAVIFGIFGVIFSQDKFKDTFMNVAGGIAGITFLFSYFGVLIYDIFWNGAFSSIWKFLQFLLAFFLTFFTSFLWAIPTTAVGIVVALGVGYGVRFSSRQIRLFLKKKRIANSECFKNIVKRIDELKTSNLERILISDYDVELVKNPDKSELVDYYKRGYSNLDEIGRTSMGTLLRKEYPVFRMSTIDKFVVLINTDKERKKKNIEREHIKRVKEKIKVYKKDMKQKIKDGKNW